MKVRFHLFGLAMMVKIAVVVLCSLASSARAATFSGNAYLTAPDPNSELTWNSTTRALTVSCWFRISIPSGTNITNHMTVLVNRADGDESSAYAYLIRFNAFTGAIEFLTRGSSELFTNDLISRPYLERWYHVAVKRSGNTILGYVDGREVFNGDASAVGNSVANSQGISIGGWNGGTHFYGDIQEVAIYQRSLGDDQIFDRMFQDQANALQITGYYRLGNTTNENIRLNNFAPGKSNHASKQGPGTVGFEETDQAGEQSLFDARKNGGEQAMVPLSGGFAWEQTALARSTPGVAFDFRFGYGSANASPGAKIGYLDPYANPVLGLGWRHTFETRIVPEPLASELRVLNWNGSVETWVFTNNLWRTRHKEYRGELIETNGGFEWITPDRMVYRFRPLNLGLTMSGRLDEIRDFNRNVIRIFWDESEGLITNVVDSVNGRYAFRYDAGQHLTNITFNTWQVNFAYDSVPRLVSKSITNTSGIYSNASTAWQFAYGTNTAGSNLLERIIDPRGHTNILVQYDKYGRKTNEVDALGRTNLTLYGVPGRRQITHIDPAGQKWIEEYDRKGRILVQRDPLGNETRYTYDDRGNRTSITEPLGWKTFFGYDDRANVIARTNALGEVTRWQFHSFFNKATNEINAEGWTNRYDIDDRTGNLSKHHDDLGTLVSYTYLSNGLVSSSTDANGRTNQFSYDANGFLTMKVDAGTNIWMYGYNELGWKLSETDALGQWTEFTLDLNGNPVLTVDPLYRRFQKTFDGNGNLLSASDAKGNFTRHEYDLANQRVRTIDRAGNTNLFSYNSRGKLERATDALGNSVTNQYDAANRLVAVIDPLGNSISNIYDANGNLTVMIDKVGQRWTKTYDRLNRVIAESDPLGNTRETKYDVVGRIKEVTTPNGFPSTHFYDGRGRLTKWLDAEGFEWKYTYDGNANIIDIEDALHGHYLMSYGPRNERLSEQNQDTNVWHYQYDPLLRLRQQTDPNTTRRTMEYDEGGRVTEVNFNTGRRHTLAYDENNNVRVATRRDSPASPPTTTQFAYDVLDRVTDLTDTHRQNVRYGYDALGRITSLTYPGGKMLAQSFDALGRLINQVFQSGAQSLTTSYAYDKAGRLIRRSYPNGVVQTNNFDTAGRITSLQYSVIGNQSASNRIAIALGYAYDRNGNKTGGSERGTLDWQLPALTDEHADYTPAGKLKTRTISNSSGSTGDPPVPFGDPPNGIWTYAYDTNGNMTFAAVTNGVATQSYALTYDEDNRTTVIRWTTNAQTTIVSNRYDALGRRVSRTLNGNRSDYVLDLSGSMERILCDLDAAGTITAWYVHGPDLAFKVSADGTLTCYHADAQANVIALSGTNGTTLAQYAYTPYGRLLGSTNHDSQITNHNPYLFVGSQGVMEELPGLYFMRARYYSAEAGVFLSTDPVKRIGPTWRPSAYVYALNNPLSGMDPRGRSFKSFLSKAKKKARTAVEKIKTKVSNVLAKTASQIAKVVLRKPPQISPVTESTKKVVIPKDPSVPPPGAPKAVRERFAKDIATQFRATMAADPALFGEADLDVRTVVAQWMLETGWAQELPGAKNLGNIQTMEVQRNYNSYPEFYRDYAKTITEKPWFDNAVGKTGEDYYTALQATPSLRYADNDYYVRDVMNVYNQLEGIIEDE